MKDLNLSQKILIELADSAMILTTACVALHIGAVVLMMGMSGHYLLLEVLSVPSAIWMYCMGIRQKRMFMRKFTRWLAKDG